MIAMLAYTNGGSWTQCSREVSGVTLDCSPTENSREGSVQGDNWLSSSHECEWAFIKCLPDCCITHIEVGK